jgi:leucyl-tRNA synthetase
MPRYDAARIEPKWQAYWEQHQTFRVTFDPSRPKMYVLDMFPYPSGDGLHVGHPEGYTATDIVCRYQRHRGTAVLHPMGWDAFGLPAEQHAIKTGTHPRITTEKNIATFKRQLKMLGFSYDWSREIATTDPDYVRWTQWIFLQLFDTWYDPSYPWTGPDGVHRVGKGRPIAELPIPADVRSAGSIAVRKYQDAQRLAYIHEAPVNWCPALGTVLANEEVTSEGKSERGNHPVERRRLKQWMLRITAYAERLIDELEPLNWSESIKLLQRNWIGRSEGAEVDFAIDSSGADLEAWKAHRLQTGFPSVPDANVIRVYTTRPDTLFGVTYMVLAPEHPLVDQITTPAQRAAVQAYRQQAALKSDLDRTDLAKEKSGVFTGGYAINPVNGVRVPVWIADYVLISYGTGAIMAVPAHDERDWEFAQTLGINIIPVVAPSDSWLAANVDLLDSDHRWSDIGDSAEKFEAAINAVISRWHGTIPLEEYRQLAAIEQRLRTATASANSATGSAASAVLSADETALLHKAYSLEPGCFRQAMTDTGMAINSGPYNGLSTAEFKAKITADLAVQGVGKKAVNYRLRDWLFSRQRYWGEPFPIWHELDSQGEPTGLVRAVETRELPVRLPEMENFQPTGTPEPLLSKAPAEWLYATAADGTRLKRETNSMPQWAGSCWYYLRFCDPQNSATFIDPQVEKYWMPVDLYIGGAEHAVLHLLYSRFWHKVLFDRGHVSHAEPFQKLVNQGMILGEMEFTRRAVTSTKATDPQATAGQATETGDDNEPDDSDSTTAAADARVSPEDAEKRGDQWVLKSDPSIVLEARSYKMSKSRGNVINPDTVVQQYGADSLRMYEMFLGPLEASKPWSTAGVDGIARFLGRVWRLFVDERAETVALASQVQEVTPPDALLRTLHKTIKAVTEDIERLSFNTAISRMMEFTNELTSAPVKPRALLEPLAVLLSPFAPHLAEECWELLGHRGSISSAAWPQYDPALLEQDTIDVPVQVNGKLRGKVTVRRQALQDEVDAAARADVAIATNLEGKTIVKTVYVPGRLLNFVVR